MGARSRAAAGILAGILAAAAGPVGAQESAAEGEAARRDFYYRVDENGAPVFTQLLRWEEDPNALEYLLVVRDSGGTVLVDERGPDAAREVHLPPGRYEYRVVTYNLLGKAEEETAWMGIEVIKAEQPAIRASFPATIYMDTLDERVTVVGDKLLESGTVFLVDARGKRYPGTATARTGDREAVFVFPDEAYRPGVYSLYAENPGGLSAAAEAALTVRFQRPVDILFSLGYSPFAALGDAWFAETWKPSFHPLGGCTQLGFLFIKDRWGSLGIELGVEGRRMEGGTKMASVTSDFALVGAAAMYKARFTRQIHGVARAGGGVSLSSHAFEYDGFSGPTTTSSDAFVRAGLALQAFLPWKVYGEIGVDFTSIFLLDHTASSFSPKLCVGYQLF